MANISHVFVLQYYYGGKFVTSPKFSYIGGNSEKLQVDSDTLCYWDIIGNAKNFSGDIVDLYVDQQSNYECFEKSNEAGEVIENINELVEIDAGNTLDVEDVTVVDDLGLTKGLGAEISRVVEDTAEAENTGRLEDIIGVVDTRGAEDTGAEEGARGAEDNGGAEDTEGAKNIAAEDTVGAEDTRGSVAIDLGFEIEDLGYDANIYNVVVDDEEQLQNGEDYFIVSIVVPSDLDEEVEEIRDKLRKTRQKRVSDGSKKLGHSYDPNSKFPLQELGLRFVDHIHFKEAVRKYAIAKGVALRYLYSEPKRLRVRCRDGCPWLLFASFDRNVECLVVKTYNHVHTCFRTNKNMLLTCKHIQKVFKDRILLDPKMKTTTLVTMVRHELGASATYDMCQRAKKVVLRESMGSYVKEYANL
ncbi:hypothetical protein V6N12_002019 [Hibiscus sabdariffa]|uniref:Transposase MuDR plant domain-containing protein n=1 Tax=Hibiscus sabdariffa TaxID=183260 RepID=A0ABR2B6D8_9ROSI